MRKVTSLKWRLPSRMQISRLCSKLVITFSNSPGLIVCNLWRMVSFNSSNVRKRWDFRIQYVRSGERCGQDKSLKCEMIRSWKSLEELSLRLLLYGLWFHPAETIHSQFLFPISSSGTRKFNVAIRCHGDSGTMFIKKVRTCYVTFSSCTPDCHWRTIQEPLILLLWIINGPISTDSLINYCSFLSRQRAQCCLSHCINIVLCYRWCFSSSYSSCSEIVGPFKDSIAIWYIFVTADVEM